MLTVKASNKKLVRIETNNSKLVLAGVVAAFIGATAFNLDIPATILFDSGRPDLALPCYQAMTSFATDLHVENVRTADALSRLAHCYAVADRTDEAVKVEQQAINMYKETVGVDSNQVFIGMARLGEYLIDKGNNLRAEMILKDAEQGLERAQVPDTEAMALVYANLAETLSEQGKDGQAEAVLQKLLPIDERLMMLKQQSVDSYDRLGALYAKQGRTNLSKQTIEAGIALKERILGANNVQIASSYEKLSEMQTVLGQSQDARKSLSRAQEILHRAGRG